MTMRNLIGALALFFRQVWKAFERQPKLGDFVPEFPLRCQHCEERIRFTHSQNEALAFVDEQGFFRCCPRHDTPHRPMPSVLG